MELFFVALSSFILNFLLGRILSLKKLDITLSYIFHIFLTIVSINFVEASGGDSQFYYSASLIDFHGLNMYFGGNFIIDLVAIFSRTFDFSYEITTLIFSSIGLSGILIFAKLTKDLLVELPRRYRYIYYLILFSPSLHFWSSLIGKDNLSLFFISLISISLIKISLKRQFNYFFLVALSLISIFFIRPHFGLIIMAGISMSFLLVIVKKTFLGLLMLLTIVPLVLFGLDYLLDYIQSTYPYKGNIFEVLSGISEVFSKTEDNTFQSNYMPIVSELNYMIAPLPTFKGGVFAIISGIELIPYCLLFFKPFLISIRNIFSFNIFKIYRFLKTNPLISSFFLISVIFTIVLSATSYNLGVVIRQRTVISPFYVISSIIYIRKINGLKLLA